jgi:hypothetical protein
MDDGSIVVDSIERIRLADIRSDLARESGFDRVATLLQTARHSSGRHRSLNRYQYFPPFTYDSPIWKKRQ